MTGRLGELLLSANLTTADSASELESFRAALTSANSFVHAFADSLPGIVYLFDSQARLLWWNETLARLTGYSPEELASAPLERFVPEYDLQRVRARFDLIMATGSGSVQTSLVLKSGEEIPYLYTGHRLDFAGAPCLIGMGMEISEQVQAERRRAVRLAIPHLLAGAVDLAAVAEPVLQTLGECLGWDVGAIWLVDPARNVLCCRQSWQAASIADATFAQATEMQTFARGIGLPGRVWASGQPAWIADVAADGNFPRASLAARVGLHSAFACPLRAGGEVLGVLEFFSPSIRPR
jgi:PAS domain S-box-containing protein